MRWILQENIFQEAAFDKLLDVVQRFGFVFSVHKVVPFIGELIPEPAPYIGKTIVFGSYSMRHSVNRHHWYPGIYNMEHAQGLDTPWGRENLLNGDGREMKFEYLAYNAKYFHGDDAVVFIRPVHDTKVFAGTVMSVPEITEWVHKVCELEEDDGSSLTALTDVIMSEPKDISREWRNWVVGGKIVSSSLYKRGNRVIYAEGIDAPALEFAEAMIKIWNPADAYVLDICELGDGSYRIVEAQCINAAGFYAGDVQKIVAAIAEMEGA
jgi:hypothetical protein